MSIKIGSNIPSLMAQRRLSESALSLGKTYERLSSGQRINSASDDAAGLAISESLRSDARLFQQSVRNINDGISMLNIAEGAVKELSGIITRITELAEQSANGVYSSKQRAALNSEAQALSEEYLRIQSTTSFNGNKLLTADSSSFSLQVGIDSSQNSILEISLSESNQLAGAVGDGTFTTVAGGTISNNYHNMVLADFNGDGSADLVGSRNSGPAHLWISLGNGDGTFATDTLIDSVNSGGGISVQDFNGDGDLDLYSSTNDSIRINNGDGTFQNEITNALGSDVQFADIDGDLIPDAIAVDGGNINFYSGNGDGTFSAGIAISPTYGSQSGINISDFNSDGDLDFAIGEISDDDFRVYLGNGNGTFSTNSIDYVVDGNISAFHSGDINGDGAVDLITQTVGELELFIGNNDGTFQSAQLLFGANSGAVVRDLDNDGLTDILVTDASSNLYSIFSNGDGSFASPVLLGNVNAFTAGDMNSDGVNDVILRNGLNLTSLISNVTVSDIPLEDGLAEFSLLTAQSARSTLTAMNEAMLRMSSVTGTIGSYQSRLLVAMNNNSVAANSYKEAESRIRDVDIAEESSRLTRLTILQQAAAAVLAQANQQPSLAVSLLN